MTPSTTTAIGCAVALALTTSIASAQQAPAPSGTPPDTSSDDAPPPSVDSGPPLQVTMEAPRCTARCAPPPPPPFTTAYLDRLPYVEGLAPPDGYQVDTEVRRGLVIAGAVVTGAPWIASASAAAAMDASEGAALAVPVLGPWLAMPTLGNDGGARAALTLSGLTQASGAMMLIIGLAVPKKSFVRYVSPEVAIAAAPLPGGAAVEVTY